MTINNDNHLLPSINGPSTSDNEHQAFLRLLKFFDEAKKTKNKENGNEQKQESATLQTGAVSQRKEGSENFNTFDNGELLLGVATWNVNHFGEKDGSLKNVKASLELLGKTLKNFNTASEDEDELWKEALSLYEEVSSAIGITNQLTNPGKTDEKNEGNSLESKYTHSAIAQKRKDDGHNSNSTKKRKLYSSMEDSEPFSSIEELEASYHELEMDYDNYIHQHKAQVINSIKSLFKNNEDWLDIIILQEVNMGMGRLKEAIQAGDSSLECISGPHMKSGNINDPRGQHEYYPIIFRKERTIKLSEKLSVTQKIEHNGSWVISGEGRNPPYPGKWKDSDVVTIYWNKKAKEPTFRPVVFHDLNITVGEKKFSDVHIGVVHTTPGASKNQEYEFQRESEFQQICDALKFCGNDGGLWIMGGDYYLSEEARIKAIDLKNIQLELTNLVNEDFSDIISEKEFRKTHIRDRLLQYFRKKRMVAKNFKKKDFTLGMAREISMNFSPQAQIDAIIFVRKSYNFTQAIENTGVKQTTIDLVRNTLRATFERQLEDSIPHWQIVQAVSGTNWHSKQILAQEIPLEDNDQKSKLSIERARYFAIARIADFFLYNRALPNCDNILAWQTVRIGLMRPEGRVAAVDTEDLKHSKYWGKISDHFPVGGRFSTRPYDRRVDEIFAMGDTAVMDASLNGELAKLIMISKEKKRADQSETWLSQQEINGLIKSSKLNRERIAKFKQALLKRGYPKRALDQLSPLRFDPRLYEPEMTDDPKSISKIAHDPNNNNNSMETML